MLSAGAGRFRGRSFGPGLGLGGAISILCRTTQDRAYSGRCQRMQMRTNLCLRFQECILAIEQATNLVGGVSHALGQGRDDALTVRVRCVALLFHIVLVQKATDAL